MPIYEFHCEGCEQDSEVLVRSTDWKGAKCPHCGSARLTKKFSTFAAAGSGSGGSAPAPSAPSCASPGGCGCGKRGSHRH